MAVASLSFPPAAVLKFLENKELQGSDHLTQMAKLVSTHKQKTMALKNPAGATWTIGNLHDTTYSEKNNMVNGWNKFYLPNIVNMQVLGVVEGTSSPCDQLVLMTCEDKRLYAYDGDELHLVASSMKQLSDKGITYPSAESYYKGEAFQKMTNKDWDKVRQGPVGQRLDREHERLVSERSSKFLHNLRSVKQNTGACSSF